MVVRSKEVGSEINLVSSVNLHQAFIWHNRNVMLEVASSLLVSVADCQEFIIKDFLNCEMTQAEGNSK